MHRRCRGCASERRRHGLAQDAGTWLSAARAAMRLLARVVVNDVDVFVHTAITMASERWNLAWLALDELASRALDRDRLRWGQRTWRVPTSTISASALSVRPGWRATGHHQQRPAELALANVRNAWARRRRWSLATVHAVESSRTAVDSPDAGRAEAQRCCRGTESDRCVD